MFDAVDIFKILADAFELEEVAPVSGAAAAAPTITNDESSKPIKRNMMNPHPSSLERLPKASVSFLAIWQWSGPVIFQNSLLFEEIDRI